MRIVLLLLPLAVGCLPTGRVAGPEATSFKAETVRRPRLQRIPRTTSDERIRIQGYATPGHHIEIYVNSLLVGETVARGDGRFDVPGVRLQKGSNLITAVAVDRLGNRSRGSEAGGGARPEMDSKLMPELRIQLK